MVLKDIYLLLIVITVSLGNSVSFASEQEILVLESIKATIETYKKTNFWGEIDRSHQLDVPRVFIVAINKNWKEEAQQIQVAVKKELFFRGLLPLVLRANELIMEERKALQVLNSQQRDGEKIDAKKMQWLKELATKYSLAVSPTIDRGNALQSLMDQLLSRVDSIPPALALGQGAYESGYGTSRFTLLGNSLFGQWTYGGDGMKPKDKRQSKGNYGVASYLWPFNSVTSYMHNLNTHPAYKGLRKERARLRQANSKLTSLALVKTLTKYSEKGQSYVDTLASIVKKNDLDIADDAYLRASPTTLIVGANNEEEKAQLEVEISDLHSSGELVEIIRSMQLIVE